MTAKPRERTWTSPPLAEGDPAVAEPLLAIIREPFGWEMEMGCTLHGAPALRFKAAPAGRGQRRATFVVMGGPEHDLADLFAMVAGLLRDHAS